MNIKERIRYQIKIKKWTFFVSVVLIFMLMVVEIIDILMLFDYAYPLEIAILYGSVFAIFMLLIPIVIGLNINKAKDKKMKAVQAFAVVVLIFMISLVFFIRLAIITTSGGYIDFINGLDHSFPADVLLMCMPIITSSAAFLTATYSFARLDVETSDIHREDKTSALEVDDSLSVEDNGDNSSNED
ncbi:MAG: hypothetical protein LBT59_14765 [Clostridiales bacterium]|jgi:hypothetical protein|nr:hypothetical protein [Clostridiales bacterium]